MVADVLEGASPGLTLSPLIAFDPDEPSAEAQAAFQRMNATDPNAQRQRRVDYISRFGFDAARPQPIRNASIREPWLGINVKDLDAVIKVAALIGTAPENVLAVWISEGKFSENAVFRGGTREVTPAKDIDPDTGMGKTLDPKKVEDGPLRAFARSFVLWDVFGLDPLTAVARRPGKETRLLGVDANHNGRFDEGMARIRTAGVTGPAGSSRQLRDYFTVSGGGLMVTRGVEKIGVSLRSDSHASWLWLQAALFDAVRRDVEQQLFAIYGAGAVDLRARPWVTYLSWNIDSGRAGRGRSRPCSATAPTRRTRSARSSALRRTSSPTTTWTCTTRTRSRPARWPTRSS